MQFRALHDHWTTVQAKLNMKHWTELIFFSLQMRTIQKETDYETEINEVINLWI